MKLVQGNQKRRRWTEKEMACLRSYWHQGTSSKEIAQALNRTVASVAAKARLLGLGHKNKKRSRKKMWEYTFTRMRNINYKSVLLPEKWPDMEHFLICFSTYATIAKNNNMFPNVSAFLREYRRQGRCK